MAILYPGLRVKKVRGRLNQGKTARVISLHVPRPPMPLALLLPEFNIEVAWDQPWTDSTGGTHPAGSTSLDLRHNFEPILPEGLLEEIQAEELEEEHA